ncbi:hypothetical protein D3C86_2161670 [compost metagenome]
MLPVVTTIEPNLLEIAIRIVPRVRLCRFSSVMPWSVPSNMSDSDARNPSTGSEIGTIS